MKKLINVKLLPTTNPNYEVKESVEELIKLCKEKTIYIMNDNEEIIGITGIKDKIYEEDGFIYGTIYYKEDLFDLTNYEWCNAKVIIDNDMRIRGISNIVYKEK